eukprot:scaffold13223_cov163-Isochrysis_galbana.AAC.1
MGGQGALARECVTGQLILAQGRADRDARRPCRGADAAMARQPWGRQQATDCGERASPQHQMFSPRIGRFKVPVGFCPIR